jgi:DNA-binding IclR family transcriptional regulator
VSDEHRVPVIERMMELLTQLEQAQPGASGGLTISDLVLACRVPRSTVYRILNSLEAHEMVVRDPLAGRYQLGPRLRRLAAHLPGDPGWAGLSELAMPHLRRLARRVGETCKLSVRDGRETMCIAGVRGAQGFALNLLVGERYPMHAGAASKVLLASMQREEAARLVAGGLPAWTEATVTDPAALTAELAGIRRQGWAEDRGEYAANVHAFAAPLRRGGEVVAAISVAFVADAPAERQKTIRACLVEAAGELSAELAAAAGPAGAPSANRSDRRPARRSPAG